MSEAAHRLWSRSELRRDEGSILACEHEGGCISAVPHPGARYGGEGAPRRPRDDEEDLPQKWWEQFEEGSTASTSGSWRAWREPERQL